MNTMTRENGTRELTIDQLDAVAGGEDRGGECNGIQMGDHCFLKVADGLPTTLAGVLLSLL